jgi:hypothetical protein
MEAGGSIPRRVSSKPKRRVPINKVDNVNAIGPVKDLLELEAAVVSAKSRGENIALMSVRQYRFAQAANPWMASSTDRSEGRVGNVMRR